MTKRFKCFNGILYIRWLRKLVTLKLELSLWLTRHRLNFMAPRFERKNSCNSLNGDERKQWKNFLQLFTADEELFRIRPYRLWTEQNFRRKLFKLRTCINTAFERSRNLLSSPLTSSRVVVRCSCSSYSVDSAIARWKFCHDNRRKRE